MSPPPRAPGEQSAPALTVSALGPSLDSPPRGSWSLRSPRKAVGESSRQYHLFLGKKKKATIPRAPGTMGFQWTWVQILTQPLSCCGAEAQILLSFFPSRAQDNADKCNPPTTPPWAGIMKSKHIMKVSDTGRLCYARSSGLL